MPLPSSVNSRNLTGATRYRDGWFGRLILQVEETYQQGHGGRPRPGHSSFIELTRWRDARGSDLHTIEWLHRKSNQPPPDKMV